METPCPVPLTPEQLAAVHAGGGYAQCEDLATRVHYHLIQFEPPTLEDDYFREKLAESQADVDRGNIATWDLDQLKRDFRERLMKK